MIEMNAPFGVTPLDTKTGGPVGLPLDRVEGPLKVTGHATYAYEYVEDGKAVFGYILGASIAKGQISSIDTVIAEQAPGVLLVLTHKNAPSQGKREENKAAPQFTDKKIHHFAQPVAFIVAETYEQARAASMLIDVKYNDDKGNFELKHSLDSAKKPKEMQSPPDSELGHFDKAFDAAAVKNRCDLYNSVAKSRDDGTTCDYGGVG